MKYIFCFLLCTAASNVWSQSAADFHQRLLSDVDKEIKKDDESFKKPAKRAPASVPDVRHEIKDVPKIDKNVRQIGPNKW